MEENIKELSEWYVQQVFEEMRRRGYTEEEIPYVIGKTGFYEALEKVPEVQLHYAIEDAVNEILFVAAAR